MASATHRMVFNTGEPAYAVDRYGTIVAWNQAAGRTFGYPAEAALGRKCWELLRGRDDFDNEYCGEDCPIRRMALRRRSVNRCRLTFRTAHGARRAYALTTLALFQDSEATLIHLCRHVEPDRAADIHKAPVSGDSVAFRGVLTRRESDVLQRLGEGHSTREIAVLLSISVSTVRSHIEHILRKLNAHSRLEAVAIARRLGLG